MSDRSHGTTSGRATYGGTMDARHSERLGALAGLTASLAVGVPVAVDAVRTGGELTLGPAWLWWVCYLAYLGVFVWDSQLSRPAWADPRLLVGVLAGLGAAAFLLAGGFGWVPVLFVVTAATAAYEWPRRATLLLVAAQTVLVAAGATLEHGARGSDALLGVVVYGSFQAFAVMMIWGQQREADARQELAETHRQLEHAHGQLRAATAMLEASSRSAERLRIARDLHDLVGHQLTALALELEVATHTPPRARSDHVRRARAIAKDLLADVREAVGELRAPRRELHDALASLIAGLPRPRVHLDVDAALDVDDETSIALLRCVQEIVTNTVRHADADTLRIELSGHDDGVTLVAADDGRGADPLRPGNGLAGIRERIEALGGSVRFTSGPGRGLRIDAEVPGR